MQGRLRWTDHGAVRTTPKGAPMRDLARQAAAAGIKLSDGAGPGVYVPGNHGGTLVTQSLSNDAVTSLIMNTADNRDIRQDTVITLNLPNLDQVKASATAQETQMRVQDALNRALVTGAR